MIRLVLCAVLASLISAPTAVSANATETRLVVFSPASPHAGSLRLSVTFAATSSNAAVAVTDASRIDGDWKMTDGIALYEFGRSPSVTARFGDMDLDCPQYTACAASAGRTLTLSLRAQRTQMLYLGLDNVRLVRAEISHAWSMRSLSYGFTRISESTAAWISARPTARQVVSYGDFQHASATTRSDLAIGMAILPCDGAGVGTATFTDPMFTEQLGCSGLFADTEVATKPGSWTIDGEVRGVTAISSRLLVFDAVSMH